MAEWTGATTEFPKYDKSQPSHCPEVLETTSEQYEAIRAIAEIEQEQLDAQ